MKVENLKERMVIKNYKILCEVLEIKQKTSDSKKAQMRELSRYCKYRKEGHSFIIEEMYDTPMEIVENRGKASKVNNSIYIENIELMMLYVLNKNNEKRLNISKSKALELTNIVNCKYIQGKNNIQRESKILGIDEIHIHEFFTNNHSELVRLFERALRNMKNKGLLIWETRYYICEKGNKFRMATDQEKDMISEYQKIYLEMNDCKTFSEAFMKNKLKDIKDCVKEVLNHELDTNMLYYYEGYSIHISQAGVRSEFNKLDIQNNKNILNKKIRNKITNSITAKNKKNKEGTFGTLVCTMSKSPYHNMRLSDKYVDIQSGLAERYIKQ